MSEQTFASGTFRPDPGRASLARILGVQALTETKLALRNGEQVLLTLLIPIVLLIGLDLVGFIPVPAPRIDTIAPRILALAIMSSAFTSQAISLGFDRRYGVLRRLAATAVPRWSIVGGRMLAALAVVIIQLVVLSVIALLLGWSPAASGIPAAVLLVLLGTAAFGALGVLLGGAVRAEIVLAVANLVWFVLLLAGGIAVGARDGFAAIVNFLPSGALAEGLHTALASGGWPGWQPIAVLAVWALAAGGLATRTTRFV
ncbi:ABC transporter permease [Sciscionella sediminilitoris]|uniref:ABC transporter permease n=1 Tax=Sciscionella sediminilitoris TaxID=1445613 RepID=UPI0004DF9084|nr:ABC transporter permease [Sciscionella sp. SE31]